MAGPSTTTGAAFPASSIGAPGGAGEKSIFLS